MEILLAILFMAWMLMRDKVLEKDAAEKAKLIREQRERERDRKK